MPFFSVIVPMYNSKKYIAECLESIIRQSEKDYEIIVVDDGSTDDSYQIASDYREKFDNIVLLHKPNGGVASARNYGIREATGQYIVFLDSDDVMVESGLRTASTLLKKKQELDMAICTTYVEFDEKNWRENHMFSDEVLQREYSAREIKIMCQNMSSMCIGIYNRSFLNRNNLRVKEGISCGEDTDFYFRSLLK